LVAEREERRRDQLQFKERQEERDRQWKDRMESSAQTMQSSWESRHQALMSTYENRLQWMQAEMDRIKQELFDAKAKTEERGDVFTQLAKMKEMQDVIKGFAPEPSSSSGGGGIGIGGGIDWKETLAEGVAERAPSILQALFGGGAPATQAAPQPQYQEGQVVQTPQGPMVVVRDPNSGQLALAPKEAIEAHQRAMAAQSGQGKKPGLLGQPKSKPRVMPDPAEMTRRGSRRRRPSAVPNLAQGLPKPRPPWEHADEDGDDDLGTPPPAPRAAPRMTTRAREAEAASAPEPMALTGQERTALSIIAKHVHESVMSADDPEEFVAKMMNQYDPNMLKAIVGGYATDQVVRGIAQVEPGGAGATPAGQEFVKTAFRQLREALQGA
jgi:hypothetical protein